MCGPRVQGSAVVGTGIGAGPNPSRPCCFAFPSDIWSLSHSAGLAASTDRPRAGRLRRPKLHHPQSRLSGDRNLRDALMEAPELRGKDSTRGRTARYRPEQARHRRRGALDQRGGLPLARISHEWAAMGVWLASEVFWLAWRRLPGEGAAVAVAPGARLRLERDRRCWRESGGVLGFRSGA